MKSKVLSILLMLVMLTAMVPAGAEGSGVTLHLWTLWNETEPAAALYKEAITQYEAESGNKVEVNWAGRDISKVVKAALDAGEAIDIFDNDAQWIDAYMGPEYLLNLDEYMAKPYPATNGAALEDTLLPILNTFAKDFQGLGGYYFVPSFPNICAIFYNKDIFAQAGIENVPMDWTWEDFLTICQKIQDAGYSAITVDDAYYCMMLGVYLQMMNGPEWIPAMQSDTTGQMWKDDSVLQMAKAYYELYEKGYFSPTTGSNVFPAGQQEIPLGMTAMYLNGSWYPNEVAQVAGPDFNWGALPFPNLPGAAETNGYISFVANGLCVNKNTQYPGEAVELISYIVSKDTQTKFAQQLSNIPATVDTPWPAVLADAEQIFNNATATTDWLGGFQNQADINAIAGEAFAKLISGNITPEQFVEELADKAHA